MTCDFLWNNCPVSFTDVNLVTVLYAPDLQKQECILHSWTDHFKKDLGSSFAYLYLQQARAASNIKKFSIAPIEFAKGELLWKKAIEHNYVCIWAAVM